MNLPRHVLAPTRVLVVPGLHGSGAQHWQSRWQQRYPAFERVEQTCWDAPDLDLWCANLARVLRQTSQPTILISHSFGCLATACLTSAGSFPVVGALLVAPADPDKFGVAHRLQHGRLPYPSIMIGSENDPWMASRRAAHWAGRWGCGFINGGALGHINAESNLGDWEFGLQALDKLCLAAGSQPVQETGPHANTGTAPV